MNVVQCCFDVVSTSGIDFVSTLCNGENLTSDFVSFSTSNQRYFNVDWQCWNNIEMLAGLITNTSFFDRLFNRHYYCAEKLLSAHKFGRFIFTTRKIINNVFNIPYWDTIPCILLPERYIILQGSDHSNFSYVVQLFLQLRWKSRNVPVGHLFELLWKISSFKDIFKSF